MDELSRVAPAFVEMAHRIVWCNAATVDAENRPRSRVLHPIWCWDGDELTGWIATSPTPIKRAHLAHSPHLSCGYWAPDHDTCVAECDTEWFLDDDTCTMVWDLFANGPVPVGYDPSIIPQWNHPTDASFAALRLTPWHLRVFPGSVLMGKGGDVLTWTRG